jgi:O-antigen ligase
MTRKQRNTSIIAELTLLGPAATLLFVLPLNHTMAMRLTALVLTAGSAFYFALQRGLISRIPLKIPLLAWIGIATLSLIWSQDPTFSLQEIKVEIGYGVLAFASCFLLAQHERAWHLWFSALLAGFGATLAIALFRHPSLQAWQTYDWEWQHGFVAYSTYLATLLPFALYLLHPARTFAPPLPVRILLIPAILFAGYATLNRMFWVTAAITVLIFFILAWARQEATRRSTSLAAGALATLLAVGLLFSTVVKERAPADGTTQAAFSDTFKHSERYQIWSFWINRIEDRPMSGVGFGRDLPKRVYADLKPANWEPPYFAHAHNLFLNYALQLGLPGLLVLLFLFAALIGRFWHFYRSDNPQVSLIGVCGIALVSAIISKNMTDDLFWRGNALLFWALSGMLLGYGTRLVGQQRPIAEDRGAL